MYNGKTVTAVILAAGNSSRMGLNLNKVYLDAGNKLIIEYSLIAFHDHAFIDEIIMVIRNKDEAYLKNAVLSKRFLNKPVFLVAGGNLRSDSVYNALAGLKSDIVIIQDGARPLIKERYITDSITAMGEYYGAVVAVKSNETMCVVNDGNIICDIPMQDKLYKAQTPQCFHTGVLRECYDSVPDKAIATDDSYFLETVGYTVKIIEGDKSNIKITTPVDIEKARQYLATIPQP